MSNVSEDQMYRPLFEEPTDALERGDAWEEPLGFLVGGMANTSLQQLAEHYFDAALLLTESIQNHRREDYRLANPTLFLYHHSIELLLKAIIGRTVKTHSLNELADAFVAFVKRECDTDVPAWIIVQIQELAKIDPGSTAFRYNKSWDKTTKKDLPVDGEFHVDLLHLHHAMDALKTALTGFLDAHEELEE